MRRAQALMGALIIALSLTQVGGTVTRASAAIVGDHSSLALGDAFSCSLAAGGGVKCWGGNSYGQLGDGTTTNRTTPVDVVGLGGEAVVSLAAGWGHACALNDVGAVRCWGRNSNGALGDGTNSDRTSAVGVVGLSSGVVAITAGGFHTCALTDAGAVRCWGYNAFGQLGDTTTTDRLTSVAVTGASSGVAHIAGGEMSTCSLTASGGVKCWGRNLAGGLGDGTTTNRTTPVDVVGLTANVAAISASGDRGCAVVNGGALKCWGANPDGELGDGTTTNRTTPVDVVGLSSGVQSVASGGTQTCALLSGGAVKCWGLYGVGDGTYPPSVRTTPVAVVGLDTGVQEIDSGSYHSCARSSAGGVTCWGGNPYGQLGIGLTEAQWPQGGRMPHDVSGSFHRAECPTLVPARHTDYSMTDGYGAGSVATFFAEPGFQVVGTAALVCQSDLTWDGTVPTAQTAGTVVVTPDVGLSGGDVVAVDLSGFAPGALVGWAQCIVLGTPSQDNCFGVIGSGTADGTGSLTTMVRVQRFIYVPAAARWVDCADPTESCVIGAADASDIPATAATASLGFAPPPDPPTTRGTITLTPPQVTNAGQTVTVHGTGFRPTVPVDLFPCTAGPTTPADCSVSPVAATTDATGTFDATMTVAASVNPPGGTPTSCFPANGQCVIAAAESADFGGTVVTKALQQLPTISPGAASITEGNTGTSILQIPVTLDRPSTEPVTVNWQTVYTSTWSNIAAVPGTDYDAANGTLTFNPGQTQQTIPITIHGDTTPEPDELIVVQFHTPTNAKLGGFYGLGLGGITNDDAFPVVTAGVGSVLEGNSGTTLVEIPVTLSFAMNEPVTVAWSTFPARPPVATAGVDYQVGGGDLTFAPGQTQKSVTVTVYGDTTPEPDEDILVRFLKPVNALIAGQVCLDPANECLGIGRILNDD